MTRRRRLLAAALVPGLLWAAAGPAAGEEEIGPSVVVEAPDDPAVRAALSFPAGWRLEAATDASRRSVNALDVDERCEVGARPSDFPDLRTDVDDFEVTLAPGSGYILIERESLALPAGPAERVDFAANEEGGRWSVYAVWDDGWVHELWCRGDELPEDRWLAIATTLELDPGEQLASSPFDPTVARPDAGVTMAFPEDWQVRGSSTNQGLLYATSEAAVCALSDYSSLADDNGWTSVEGMHDDYVAVADGRDNLVVNEAAYLELPAGRAGLADISFDDGTRAIRYSFGDERGRLMALFCIGEPTPEDRYLSLARSLAWLPDEGDR